MGSDPSVAAPRRVGLFGGTFDPPHVGHVRVVTDVADALELDTVLWIPCGIPPHKRVQVVSPPRLRLEMTRAATTADTRFEVSMVETEREGPSYTVDTIRELRAAHPGDELVLIIGSDQFRALAYDWLRPEEILEGAELAVMDREGKSARALLPDVPGAERATFVPVRRVDVSSTAVRQRVAEGRDISDLVPEAVRLIIDREALYSR